MDLVSPWKLRIQVPAITTLSPSLRPCPLNHRSSSSSSSFPFWANPFRGIEGMSPAVGAKKRNSEPHRQPVLKPTIVEEVSMDDDDEGELLLFDDDFEDETMMDGEDEYFEDDNDKDDAELYVGDGGGGGGISLAGMWWDKEALRIAEEVCSSFDGELKLYAFKTLSNSTIQVRIERLTNKSGSPSMEDIEAFSTTYRAWLDEAELSKIIPDNVALEVSSPGVERVVRVPEELDRFKERAMYVKYVSDVDEKDSSLSESEGVFRLISFDVETECCTWGLADVRINRERAGKGRPLSKKQRDWQLNTPFRSLRLVRIYSEI